MSSMTRLITGCVCSATLAFGVGVVTGDQLCPKRSDPVTLSEPRSLPQFPAPGDNHADEDCTEDEFGYSVRADLTICVHVKGDGWRPVETG